LGWLDALYVRACRSAGKVGVLRGRLRTAPELRENLEFIGLPLHPDEVAALALLSCFLGAAALLLSLLASLPLPLLALLAPLPLVLFALAGWYPSWRATQERVKALGEAPQLVCYLVIGMGISPNLERSMRFAAEHVDGPLGKSLREHLSRTHLREYSSAGEALEKFGECWGRWREDLKRSLDLLRGSSSERGEGRVRSLDRALDTCLSATSELAKGFASQLHLPTLMLYTLGVLLPLVLLAAMPVLLVIGVGFGVPHLFAIYCIALPAFVYALSRHILAKRPATFPPPELEPGTSRLQSVLPALALGVAGIGAGFSLSSTPLFGSLVSLWGLVLGVSLYLHLSSSEPLKARREIGRAEEELCDTLTQLGNRMAEGRPMEEALEHVASTSRGGALAGMLSRVSAKIKLGSGLRIALLDPEGEAWPARSKTIRGIFAMLVDVAERSTREAGKVALRISDHLRELKRVELEIKHHLGEIVTSMRSVALFFAPLIASITARMQHALASGAASVPGFLDAGGIPSWAFTLALGIYTVLLAAILISYAVEIELGNDKLAKRAALARSLPLALGVFTLGTLVGGQLLSGVLGSTA